MPSMFNILCQRCEALTRAKLVRLHYPDDESNRLAGIPMTQEFIAVEKSTTASLRASELQFRRAWPAARLLEHFEIRPSHCFTDQIIDHDEENRSVDFATGLSHINRPPSGEERFFSVATLEASPETDDGQIVIRFHWLPELKPRMPDIQSSSVSLDTLEIGMEFRATSNLTLRRYHSTVFSLKEVRQGGVLATSLTRIRHWMNDCTKNHTRCPQVFRPQSFVGPTRLLRVYGLTDRIRVRLIETAYLGDRSENLRYITLSHCWGPIGIAVKLCKDNRAAWLQDIPFDSLARNFREAIAVTIALGVSYLWIDALCIVQDSEEDWEFEGSRMSSVYSQALVTLAASAAVDSDQGLILQNYKDAALEVVLGFQGLGDWNGTWSDCELFDDPQSCSPLYDRAWVLQEMIISSRLIQFAESDIWWSCSTDTYRETGHAVCHSIHNPFQNLEHDEWRRLLEVYTGKKLIFAKDRLAAIAGIANAYAMKHEIPMTDYIAGMWRHELREHLLWLELELPYHRNTKQDDRIEERLMPSHTGTKPRNVPSWSWASTQRSVTLNALRFLDSERWNPSFQVCCQDPWPVEFAPPGPLAIMGLRVQSVILRIAFAGSSFCFADASGEYVRILESGYLRKSRVPHAELHLGTGWPTHAVPVLLHRSYLTDPKREKINQILFHLIRQVDHDRGIYTRSSLFLGYLDTSPITKDHWASHPPDWYSAGHELSRMEYRRDLGDNVYQIEII